MKDPLAHIAQSYLITIEDVRDIVHSIANICRTRRLDPARDDRSKVQHWTAENVVREIADEET